MFYVQLSVLQCRTYFKYGNVREKFCTYEAINTRPQQLSTVAYRLVQLIGLSSPPYQDCVQNIPTAWFFPPPAVIVCVVVIISSVAASSFFDTSIASVNCFQFDQTSISVYIPFINIK